MRLIFAKYSTFFIQLKPFVSGVGCLRETCSYRRCQPARAARGSCSKIGGVLAGFCLNSTGDPRPRRADHGARIADGCAVAALRGARFGSDQYRIGGHGAGIAGRGTFGKASGRRGAADYTRKKDTKNPALGGVDRIGLSDQPWKVNDPLSITSRTMSRVRSSSGSPECSATASAKL